MVGDSAIKAVCTGNQRAMDSYHAHSKFALDDGGLRNVRMAQVEALVDDARRQGIMATDSLSGATGIAFARQLEEIISKVYEEKYAPNDALRLYGVERDIQPGKTTYTQRRKRRAGKWEFISAGNPNLPTGSIQMLEKSFRIVPAGHAVRVNMFENMSAELAGINLQAELRKVATETADEFVDDNAWVNSIAGLASILGHPFVNRVLSAVTYGDASSADAIAHDFHQAVDLIHQISQGALGRRLRVITGNRMNDYLSERYRNAFDRQSIKDGILDKNSKIASWEVAHRLDGAGTGGRDIIIIEDPSFKKLKIPRGVTFLPPQREGFDMVIPAYMLFGGVNDVEPMSTVILEVETDWMT